MERCEEACKNTTRASVLISSKVKLQIAASHHRPASAHHADASYYPDCEE
jgi:hypothetical protein